MEPTFFHILSVAVEDAQLPLLHLQRRCLDRAVGGAQTVGAGRYSRRRERDGPGMNAPNTALQIGFLLDRRYHWLRGEMDTTKEPALIALASVLNGHGVAWTIIGGIAAQVHLEEPRTTLDIDVAILTASDLPIADLQAAGFRHGSSHAHSDNWTGPGDVPVQFSADPAWRAAISRASQVVLGDATLPVLAPADLLRAKLVAARDPGRRRSKRLRDVADALALVEQMPILVEELSEDEQAWLDGL